MSGRPGRTAPREPVECTLLELVSAVGDSAGSERETVATLLHLVRSGRVRLIGTFRGQPL